MLLDIFLYKVFEIVPEKEANIYSWRKPFFFNMDSSDEEVIVIAAIAKKYFRK